jgi:hypothetical protein
MNVDKRLQQAGARILNRASMRIYPYQFLNSTYFHKTRLRQSNDSPSPGPNTSATIFNLYEDAKAHLDMDG